MKGILRYLASLLAVLLLLSAAVLGLFGLATTEFFVRETLGTDSLLTLQQAEIDDAADALAARWQLSPEVLAPYAADAAARQSAALAAWWHGLWHDPQADAAIPVYLDEAQEREMIAAIMADESFAAATDAGQRRAIARDEIAYVLDEAVCDALMPLRRSIVDLGVTMAAETLDLPLLRQAALLGAGVLAALALLLLLMARRAAGSTMIASAVTMVLVSVPAWLLDVPGMLKQLSPMAYRQGTNVLLGLGAGWYGAALALALPGLLILCVKRAVRRRRV